MKRHQRKIVSVIVFAALAYFVSRPMYYPGVGNNPRPQRVLIQPRQSEIVEFAEMDKFLHLWSEFLELHLNSDNTQDLLIAEAAYAPKISGRARRWIKKQGWETDRFFYVGRRLKSIVRACQLKVLGERARESLEIQLRQEKDSGVRRSIADLLEEQSRMYLAERVSEGEIDMVMPHLGIVSDILDGKLIYRPERKK